MCSGPYIGSPGRVQFEVKLSKTVSRAQRGGRRVATAGRILIWRLAACLQSGPEPRAGKVWGMDGEWRTGGNGGMSELLGGSVRDLFLPDSTAPNTESA